MGDYAQHKQRHEKAANIIQTKMTAVRRNPKYSCKDAVSTCFVLIGLISWRRWIETVLWGGFLCTI